MIRSRTLAPLAAACALAVASAGAMASQDKASAKHTGESASATQAIDDAWITAKVKAELATTDGVKSTDISVTTANGRVTLTGVLPTETGVNKAVAVTRAVKGVQEVDSAGLKVGEAATLKARDTDEAHSSSPAQAVDDTWITTKVKAELATTDGVPSDAITVKTVDGVVTLTGTLPGELTVKKAVAAARSVKGVKQVDAAGLAAKH